MTQQRTSLARVLVLLAPVMQMLPRTGSRAGMLAAAEDPQPGWPHEQCAMSLSLYTPSLVPPGQCHLAPPSSLHLKNVARSFSRA